MVINIIECNLPKSEALIETTSEYNVHNIYIKNNLPEERKREVIKHELSHLIQDDFNLSHHVNLVESMVRQRELLEEELENINFYYHYLNNADEED